MRGAIKGPAASPQAPILSPACTLRLLPLPMNTNALFQALHRIKSHWPLVLAILVIDTVAMGYGWFYYWQVGQFDPSTIYFVHWAWWPLVADSPNAVLLFWVALLAYRVFGRRSRWLDGFAFILNVYVGLWTTMLFLLYPGQFGTWDWGSTNNILFFAHFGMPLQALILVHDLRQDAWSWRPLAVIAAALAAYIVVDYVWPGFHPAPFIHGADTALHVASPLLMATVFAAFVAIVIRGRARQRSSPP